MIWSFVEEVCRWLEDRNMFANRRNMKPAILDACCTFVMGISVSGLSTVQGQVLLQLADCKGAAGKFMVPRMYGKPSPASAGTVFHSQFWRQIYYSTLLTLQLGIEEFVSRQFLPVVEWDGISTIRYFGRRFLFAQLSDYDCWDKVHIS